MRNPLVLCLGLALFVSPLAFADIDPSAGEPLPPAGDYESPHASSATVAASPPSASVPSRDDYWFRDAGEYLSHRSVRMGVPNDFSTFLNTDGRRFDADLAKRIALLSWSEEGFTHAWSFGVDGSMLASLRRYTQNGQLTFATNNFDGSFGAWLGFMDSGWIALLRIGHLSAHLVDNSPDINRYPDVRYSQFWNEAVLGKTFPEPSRPSNWEVHVQGSVGFNFTSQPARKQPRASAGISAGYTVWKALAVLGSADALHAGVDDQKNSYALFLGVGTLNRPDSKMRPFRIGVAHFTGSDYRNQYFDRRQSWTAAQVATEF